MRRWCLGLLCGCALLALGQVHADEPVMLGLPGPAAVQPPANPEAELQRLQASADALRKQQAVAQAGAQKDDKLKQQVELLQKQIEVQQKMILLLMENMKKQTAAGPAVEKLETKLITLEARSKQAAQRDVELAHAVDAVVEHQDALERYGPYLPAPLRELFLPSNTNETPLSIYGALAFGFSRITGNSLTSAQGITGPRNPTPGGFYFGEFTPDFLLKLNDWIFLSAELAGNSDGSASLGSFAEADFFLTDWLTVSAGRMVAPIGWFNYRINNPWINKLPGDAPGSGPPLWSQVLPPMSLLGIQAQGGFYLAGSPLKMEYNLYVSNGLNLGGGAPTYTQLADLGGLVDADTFTPLTNDHMYGGRLGLWYPELGLAGGVSGMVNGDFVGNAFENSLNLWAIDLNYHKGNWDARFEYGTAYQQTFNFIGTNIRRQGLYAQVAYRPRDCCHPILQNLEFVYRYSYVEFNGIDPTQLDLTAFGTPMDVPVRRHQHEVGVNYWLAQRAVIKFAFQYNNEPGFQLHDNQFLTEFAWGW